MTDFNEDLILKHLQDKLTSEERMVFETWLDQSADNQKTVTDFQRIWELGSNQQKHIDFKSGEEWTRLQGSLNNEGETTRVVAMRPLPLVYKIAASITLLLAASFILYFTAFRSHEIISETTSQTMHLVLPDGSEVWLNEKSKLVYHDDFSDNRSIALTGEAFFQVKPDPQKPFVIHSEGTEVKVLGTSFNVRAYPDERATEVNVITGKVSFTETTNSEGLLLTPGMNGVFNKKEQTMKQGSEEHLNTLAWKDKKLVFKKTPLHEVIKTLRSYFKADIQLKNTKLSACRFTSTFNDPTLQEVIEALSLSLNLKVDHQSAYYMLDGEGCATN